MNDDLENLLRAEFAARAAGPADSGEGLAEAAIGGAKRIRRRRRVTAASSGLSLIVLGAVAIAWTPWSEKAADDPPAASTTTTDEAQTELEIEFVVERNGAYGVADDSDRFVPLETEEPPTRVERLHSGYLVSSQDQVNLIGSEENFEYDILGDEYSTVVRSDAESFAISYQSEDSARTYHDLFTSDGTEPAVSPLDLSSQLTLEDWSESVVVLSADMISVSGGVAGPHHFDDQFDWGLDTAAEAGFESAVISDPVEPNYVCVSDLEPGVEAPDSEECGYLSEPDTRSAITEASLDASAADFVTTYSESAGFREGLEGEITGDSTLQDRLLGARYRYIDPGGRWEIGFEEGDQTWALLLLGDQEAAVSELTPPGGALMPVESHI